MSNAVRSLEPRVLWNYFADLNAVPRASKHEEKVIQFMMDFGKQLNLETKRDDVGNVIIKKPATAGMEARATVVLQSHLDMVHQKNADTSFDFSSQGIDMLVEGDWVRANGTTLGADNGIGVASIMTILSSTDIPHPAIEALFTIDEETGMTGALGLSGGLLDAKILLNLDTEDDRELTIGCAGGLDITASGTYTESPWPNGVQPFQVVIKGLTGGHSGMDIHKGRGNANKLMNRLLANIQAEMKIAVHKIDGGGLRNAIPRESFAIVGATEAQVDQFKKLLENLAAIFKAEHRFSDPNFNVEITPADQPATIIEPDFLTKFLKAVQACPNGIYRMSPDIPALVQSSNNVARILVNDGSYSVMCLSRSAVDSEKMDLALSIRSAFELIGANISFGSSYPGWMPDPTASIVKLMSSIYRERAGEDAEVNACHAGLECGIIGKNYPGMEMISFGPNIRGAHSPEEKVQVSSVQKYWPFLLETLARIPSK